MAPPKVISTADLFQETHVDIDGTPFRVREATRSVEENHRELAVALERREAEVVERAQEADGSGQKVDETRDIVLELYGDILDIWLESLDERKKTPAKTVAKRAYKADKIGFAHLRVLIEEIAGASVERPT